ncbi:MAG: ABC transporter permease subunit [Clostridia bacterium]|nr:ABC transporter permease subunit [Clostridia bacterium]
MKFIMQDNINKSKIKNIIKKLSIFAAVAAFWIAVWQLLYLHIGNMYILPSPLSVGATAAKLAACGEFWLTIATSFVNIFKGFLLAQITGIFLARITARSKIADAVFAPVMAIIKATPIASFIILLLVMLGKEAVPETAAFLIVLPTVWENIASGIKSFDKKLWEVTKIYNFSLKKKIKYFYMPSIMPFYIPAFKATFGMAWKAGIAAEVICNIANTIGGKIYDTKVYLEIPELFAWTAVTIIVSILIEKILLFFINLLNRKGRK